MTIKNLGIFNRQFTGETNDTHHCNQYKLCFTGKKKLFLTKLKVSKQNYNRGELISTIYAKHFHNASLMTKRSGYKQNFEEKMLLYLWPSNPLKNKKKISIVFVRSANKSQ